jgi:signal transduction histidine kinase
LITSLLGQTPYILKISPTLFEDIEQQLMTEEITDLIENCEAIFLENKNPKEKGIAAFYIGQASVIENNYSLANKFYIEANLSFQSISFTKGLAFLRCKQGELYYSQGDFTTANSFLNQAIDYAQEEQLYLVLKDAYKFKVDIYSLSQQPDSSFFALKNALHAASFLPDKEISKDILTDLATDYQSVGQLDSSILYFQKLITLNEELNDIEGLTSDYTSLGNLFRERGSYDLAREQYISAERMAKENQDSLALLTIFAQTGDLYETQGLIDQAKEYYLRTLEIATLQEDDYWKADSFKKLGNLAVLQKKEQEAIEYFKKALIFFKEINNVISVADIQIQLSQFSRDKKQYLKTKTYLQEAIAMRQKANDKMSLLQAKMALGELEIIYDNPNIGIKYIEECIVDFEAQDNLKGLQESYELLTRAFQKKNQYKKAFTIYQKANILKDSLTSLERTKVIDELGKKYDMEIKDNMLLQKDKELLKKDLIIGQNKLKIQRRNNQLILLGSFLLITSILIISLYYRNKKNKELNQQKIEVLKQQQEAQLLKSLIKGEEKERKRIGQELHDGLGAVLATVKMHISSISGKIPAIENNPNYQKAEDLIDEACNTVREVSHEMMPYLLEQQGLEVAIEDICQTISSTKNITVHFNPYQIDLIQTDILKFTIYRISQELLKNIIKHAKASEIIVQLTVEDNQVELLIEDDGIGFDPQINKNGIGLSNINSRVDYLKGSFELNSIKDKGSTFIITLPLNKNYA